MKKIIAALTTTCLLSFGAMAQATSGAIAYKETIKLDIQLEGEMAAFAAMLPKEQSFDKVLYFSPEASVYKLAPKKEEKPAAPGGIRKITIGGNGSDEVVYRDVKAGKTVAQRDFMTRKFLVSGDNKKTNWKMTGKQKTILGYTCQEATSVSDTDKVTAWFTPAIPVSAGPADFSGLPGMILEASIGEMYTIVATEVKPGEADKKQLSKPTEGKKMSREEFEAMVVEKTKEMQEETGMGAGGNKNVIIKIQH